MGADRRPQRRLEGGQIKRLHPAIALGYFSYNAGGLGSGMYEELMHYLDTAAYDMFSSKKLK